MHEEQHGPHGLYGPGARPEAHPHPAWRDPHTGTGPYPPLDPATGQPQTAMPDGAAPLDMETLETAWDLTAELEQLLQRSAEREYDTIPGFGPPVDPPGGGPLSILDGPGPANEPPAQTAPASHRRPAPVRASRNVLVRTVSGAIAALAAVIGVVVGLLGVFAALDPLWQIADRRDPTVLGDWWPVLVYGPWAVAALAILRACLHRRRALHSWTVVLFFSAVAVVLCVLQAPRTLADGAAAALPPLAALACFHQLVRLITLLRPPRRALSRRRHRSRPSGARPGRPGGGAAVTKAAQGALPLSGADPLAGGEGESVRGGSARQGSAGARSGGGETRAGW
ncbi:hypothetical protein ACFVIM_05815 [Streptomyces sp. NPDC057638]|uniref:hypothetical protein n=1 Tax=Streptomyces sp. NPDC057638 TaxID=3346190 RepID=UPI0036AF827F